MLDGRWLDVDAGNYELWAVSHHHDVFHLTDLNSNKFFGTEWK
jgi:hypothetical protein